MAIRWSAFTFVRNCGQALSSYPRLQSQPEGQPAGWAWEGTRTPEVTTVPLMSFAFCHFFSQTSVLWILGALPKHNQPQDVLIRDVCVSNYHGRDSIFPSLSYLRGRGARAGLPSFPFSPFHLVPWPQGPSSPRGFKGQKQIYVMLLSDSSPPQYVCLRVTCQMSFQRSWKGKNNQKHSLRGRPTLPLTYSGAYKFTSESEIFPFFFFPLMMTFSLQWPPLRIRPEGTDWVFHPLRTMSVNLSSFTV